MMKNTGLKLLMCMVLFSFQSNSQIDDEKKLFSKMDVSPQFELWDGNLTMLMGFTELLGGSINLPSPILTFTEGDSVRLTLTNFSQAAPHTIHLHGLDVNQENDGVPHLSFEVEHSEEGEYIFKAPQAGTYLYHCHVVSSLHVQAGMYGLIIVKPADESNTTWTGGYEYNREFAMLMSEIDTNWHSNAVINAPHDPMVMEYPILDYKPQYFLVNGGSEQQLIEEDMFISGHANEQIYLRFANVGYYGNRVVFPNSLNSKVISSDGRPLPVVDDSGTLEIMPGERYGVLINPEVELSELITVEYFNLNTAGVVSNTQNLKVEINGFMNLEAGDYSESSIGIFPNPAKDFIRIDLNGNNVENLYLYNVLGEEVLKTQIIKNTNNIEVGTKNLNNGIYILKYSLNGIIQTEKIIINK